MNNSPADRRSPLGLFPDEPISRLYGRAAEVLRTRHYSRRLRRFIRFHGSSHPRQLTESDVRPFLRHLAFRKTWRHPHALEAVTQQAATVAARHWRLLVMPPGKGSAQVSLYKSWASIVSQSATVLAAVHEGQLST